MFIFTNNEFMDLCYGLIYVGNELLITENFRVLETSIVLISWLLTLTLENKYSHSVYFCRHVR